MPWKKSEPMEQRIEFGLRALEGGNFRALCREYGITARTGYKWRERLVLWGIKGLREESRRPHHTPRITERTSVCTATSAWNWKESVEDTRRRHWIYGESNLT